MTEEMRLSRRMAVSTGSIVFYAKNTGQLW